ncbi:hypothetical protein CO178_00585 [candidate division WWE3 bacterium CG_4_9_14_3_um_filter_34_6]|uniref:Type II secretion system protein GspG C-terminal domain-containing protein n=1 Tax=candidate division WWE3 bacterium CG_4_9_14_3_um_filter_34_6 TaxID=1975079 RepID=A0A2M7X518_UNCKA|nr:MAG: hypothetical protein CO178_00585 [candidate division WWE3 bacterium CG_4_9_14_3_um_filter_34_6]
MASLFKGLTLIEIVIVIAIMAILSGLVLVTLNPKEQTSKTTDSNKKTDSAGLLGAIDRFYTSYQGQYPWELVANCSAPASNGSSTVNSCWLNKLVSSGELQQGFADSSTISSFIVTLNSQGVHVCFAPESKAFLAQALYNSSGTKVTPGTHICVPE